MGADRRAVVEAPAPARRDRLGPVRRQTVDAVGPGTVHDYMHAKITVADDVVFLGSFNLSHSGEMNSENVLEIHDPALAERLAGYVDGVRARYPVASLGTVPEFGTVPSGSDSSVRR